MAMNEAEPSAIAAQSKNLLQNLRALQHKDINGNVITDPDVSNPTRWREERPLATILAFEAAIDGNYRNSMVQTSGDADSVMSGWNRRSSYYASGNTGRLHHESYYGSRPQSSFRPENSQGQNPWGPPPDRRRIPRVGSEPQQRIRTNGANVYAAGTNQRSYETVASGSGTSGEQAGYQTDPTSSENSSIDRRQSPAKRDPANDFGIGFSQAAEYQPSAFSVAGQGGPQPGQDNGGGAPAVPPKAGSLLRKATTQERDSYAKTHRESTVRFDEDPDYSSKVGGRIPDDSAAATRPDNMRSSDDTISPSDYRNANNKAHRESGPGMFKTT
ncbi:hypothetical protein VPNG_01878 [Cytospora leucostoma]|uniref:Uncharacterized protein n=1 Tax=Cytospora leucostoma TaxID=1230097 RepID=A0A423XJ25_9PEZI|nr:hypothetical protein VPNG_01878 [Cytospora leucostoma]